MVYNDAYPINQIKLQASRAAKKDLLSMSDDIWYFDSFNINGRLIRLKEPIPIPVVVEDDGYSASYEPLNIYVYESEVEALKEYFSEVVAAHYNAYYCAEDEELTLDALEIKAWFIQHLLT